MGTYRAQGSCSNWSALCSPYFRGFFERPSSSWLAYGESPATSSDGVTGTQPQHLASSRIHHKRIDSNSLNAHLRALIINDIHSLRTSALVAVPVVLVLAGAAAAWGRSPAELN